MKKIVFCTMIFAAAGLYPMQPRRPHRSDIPKERASLLEKALAKLALIDAELKQTLQAEDIVALYKQIEDIHTALKS